MHPLRSKAHIVKKRKQKKRALIVILLILVCVLSSFFYYAYASRFHVKNVMVSGASFASGQEVEMSVHTILSDKLWGIVPKRSSLLVGKRYVERQLSRIFPSIKKVQVSIKRGVLFVEIEERLAVSVICTHNEICYYMDEDGFVFAHAPQFGGSSFIKIKTVNDDLVVGKTAIDKDELQKIAEEIAIFESFAIGIQYVLLTSDSEIRFIGPFDTAFIVQRQDNVQVISDRLKAIVGSRPEVISGKYEYVDLRIESKIFLKRRES